MKPRRQAYGKALRRALLGAGLLAGPTLAVSCSSGAHPASRTPAAPGRTGAGAGTATPPTTARSTPTQLKADQELWRLSAAVSRPVVLPAGSRFVVLGGLATGDVSTSRIVEVDPATGDSQLAGHLALAVHDSAGAVIGGRWYLFGGGSYSTVATIQAWSSGSATEAGRLPDPRSDLSAATLGTTTYIAGGFDGTAMTSDVLATTDGLTFRTVGRLAVPVRYAAVAASGGSLWVIGGVTSTGEGGTAETDAIQRVDLASGQVSVAGHLGQPMGHATALVLDGQIFVVGGRSGTVPSAAIWRLDTSTASLQPAGHLPQAVSDAGSVVAGGVGYLVGGEVSGPAQPLDTVIALRPVTG